MREYIKKLYSKSETEFNKLLLKNLKNDKKMFIVTANPETLMIAKKDEEFNKIITDSNVTLTADGIALVKASQKYHQKCSKITGVDIAVTLLKDAESQKKKVYLFGATKEVINALVDKLSKDYPHLNLVGYSDGYVQDKDQIFLDMVKLEPDVILVAMGIPKQEKLIYKHLEKFKKGIFVGVGGTFDVLSGMKKRAPKIFLKTHTEWLYRILREPKRLKRFFKYNVKFMFNIYFSKDKA